VKQHPQDFEASLNKFQLANENAIVKSSRNSNAVAEFVENNEKYTKPMICRRA
jgi:hypothetical protein